MGWTSPDVNAGKNHFFPQGQKVPFVARQWYMGEITIIVRQGQNSLFRTIVRTSHFLVDFLSLATSIFCPSIKKAIFLSLELLRNSRDKNIAFLISWQKMDVSRDKKSPKKCLLSPAGAKKAIFKM